MSKGFVVALLTAMTLGVRAADAPPATTNHAPKIVCEQPEFDFGQAEAGTTVSHDYVIRNAGDLTLEVKRVQPSCGCTVANISQRTLKPGETANITATLNLAGRQGKQDKHILVESDDPATPNLILALRGEVKQEFSLVPDRLTPGQIRNDQPVELALTFANNSAVSVQVTKVETTMSNVTASVTTLEPGRKYQITVRTVPPLTGTGLDGTVKIFTDHPQRGVFDVPFSATVLGPLVVAPGELLLSTAVQQPISRFIVIQPGQVKTFKVLGVELPDPTMTWEQHEFGVGTVRVQIGNILAKPELQGKAIKIKTDVPTMSEILIPLKLLTAPQ